MSPPPDQRAKIWQDTVIEKHNLRHMDCGTQGQNKDGHQDELQPIPRPYLGRGPRSEHINQTPQIGDKPDLDNRNDDRGNAGEPEHTPERLCIFPQKRKEPPGRCVALFIWRIRIDKTFEPTKHGSASLDYEPAIAKLRSEKKQGRETCQGQRHSAHEDAPCNWVGQQI